MHKCYTVRDWIVSWEGDETGDHALGSCLVRERGGPVDPSLCPACQHRLEGLPGPSGEVIECPDCMAALDELDNLLVRLEHFDPRVATEAAGAEVAYQELVPLPLEKQRAKVASDQRFRTWSLCQRFLKESESLWRHDPHQAHARSETALAIVRVLDEDRYHPRWVADLRGKAHAYLGNTFRTLARFEDAERELEEALRQLRHGVESGIQEARILSLLASLRMDQGRHDEAEQLLDRIADYYRASDQSTELARTQLKRAGILEGRGAYRAAAEECAQAYGNLAHDRQSRLAILACQNALYYLLKAGDIERARGLFSTLAPTDERMVLLQRRWIEANLLQAEGRFELATEAYEDTRSGYAAEGLPYDVALVALDQAMAAYELGDHQAMAELAREAGALLGEAGARHETLAVLRVLRLAIEQGTVTRSVLSAIRKRVADNRPSG